MKITSKILLSTFTIFYFHFSTLFAMEEEKSYHVSQFFLKDEETRKEEEYKCIFDIGNPVPDLDNPYQARPTRLSENFLEKHKETHPSYHFPTTGNQVIILGDYRIDKSMRLGYGDNGTVYLGKHEPTGIYVAAKSRKMVVGEEKKHVEYRSLRALGQLYSAWRSTCYSYSTPNPTYSLTYLIIPFVDGNIIDDYQFYQPWINTKLTNKRFEFSDLPAGMRLLRSMVRQLNYISERGVTHDSSSGNSLITYNYKDIILLDFGYPGDFSDSTSTTFPALNSLEFNVYTYAFNSHYFLGTREYLTEIRENKIEGPQEIIEFFNALHKGYSTGKHFFSLNDFNNAFEVLEKSLEEKDSAGFLKIP